MSNTIDNKVVSMQFDNQHFERNVSTTLGTLEKLKQSLRLDGATKGLTDVSSAAGKVNSPMSNLGGVVESVQAKFSALQVMGVTALANITNSAVNAGKRIASALTIDPIKTGFQEYETQIGAVQTILANTESKGSTLQDVNSALDTLNTYADKTIYNFTEMTRNIGTFTAAGVALDTSVSAIQGIANLAAVSGSTSQQASTAMYQLSQALSSGTVKLMDWNSVVNAGMGGQVFQDALKQTARVNGVAVDDMIKKHGSFRESLQEGWITADILTQTLQQFTMAAEEGSEEWNTYKKSLMDTGYSEEQAISILKMANTATDAATKVKTFTQLWDTLKESVQSGWTQSWEIIIGDFGEAKNFLTDISNRVGEMVGASADARNEMLEGGLSSGWKQLLGEGIADEAGYVHNLKAVAKGHKVNIDKMIEDEKKLDSSLSDGDAFQKALKTGLKDGSITADMLSESVHKMSDTMSNLSAEQLKAAGYTADHVKQIKELSKGLKDGSISMDEFVKKMSRPSGRENLIEALWNAFDGLMSVITPIKEAFREIFPPTTGEQLYAFTEAVLRFSEKLTLSRENAENLKRTFKGVFALLDIGVQVIKALFKGFSNLVKYILPAGEGLLDFTGGIGDYLVALDEAIKSSDIFNKAIEYIGKFLKPIGDVVKKVASAISDAFSDISVNAEARLGPLSVIGKLIVAIFSAVGKIIERVLPWVTKAAQGIGNAMSGLMDKLATAIQDADYDKFFDMVSGGILAAIGVFIAKFIKGGGDLLDGAGGFLENINGILEGVSDALGAFTQSIKADTLKKIATAIAILAASLLVISLIDSEKLTASLGSITLMFTELMAAMSIFGKLSTGKGFKDMLGMNVMAAAMGTLAKALLTLSIALKIMSTMSPEAMAVALTSMTVGLGELVGAVYLMTLMPEKKVNASARAIQTLASALLVLSIALKIMSTMSWGEMGVALVSMTVGLGALVGAVYLLPQDTALRAAGMIGLATAMVILGAALKIMATMSWEEVAKSLVALAGSLAAIAIAMKFMTFALPGALAMLVIAPALVVLAGALKIMGTMSWGEVARGLTLLAGSLLLIAAAATVMIVALPGAAAILVMAASLAVLTPVMLAFGSMSWEEIGKSLLMLAGVFVVFGLSALVLQPLILTMIGLAAALALLGAACAAVGVGVLALCLGLTMIAAAGSSAALALVTIVSSVISLIPYFIEQVGLGIIKLCEVIAGSASAICEAVTTIITSVVDAVVQSAPAIVAGVLTLLVTLLELLIEYMPQIVPLLVDLIVTLLQLLGDHTPALVSAIFVFLGKVIESIATNIATLLEPLVNLFGLIFQGIADVLGPIVESVLAPILQVISDLIVGVVEAIAPYIPEITAMVETVATVIADAAVKITQAVAPFIPDIARMVETIVNAFVTLAALIAPILDSIAGLIEKLGTAISRILLSIAVVIESVGGVITGIFQGIADVISSIGDAIAASLDSLAGVFDSVFNGIAEVVTSVGDSIRNVLDGISGIIDSIGDAALNAGTGFENLANGVKTITDLKLGDMVASLAAVAAGVGDIAKHRGKIKDLGSGMSNLVSSIASLGAAAAGAVGSIGAMLAKLSSLETDLPNIASNALTKFTSVLTKQTSSVEKACTTLVTSGASAASDASSSFEGAGKDLGAGLVKGINAKKPAVYAAAYALGQLAVQGENDGQASASPSKLTIQSGKWLGEGLIIGIDKMKSKVYDAGHSLGDTATSTISYAVSRIADAIDSDIDAQPTIRPVVDLTDVESGAATIGGLLSGRRTLSIDTSTASAAAASMSGYQNRGNSDVVSAIKGLRKDISGMHGDTYSFGNFTYSGDSEVADAVQTLVRAARVERRV